MNQAQMLCVNDQPCDWMRSIKNGWMSTREGTIRVTFPATDTEDATGVQEWVKMKQAT